jgi:hypothetical protein
MKKSVILLILAVAFLTAISSLLLVSCKSNDETSFYGDNASDQKISSTDSTQIINTPINYTISQETLTENSNNNNISIKYPQLISDVKDFSKTNQLINDTIKDYLKYEYGDNYTDLMLDVDYQTTLSNSSLISIVFEGLGNVSTAAHPNNIFFSLNINLKDSMRLRLQDIYAVDNEFTNTVMTNLSQQTSTEISDYVTKNSKNGLAALLINADSSESNIYSYLTDNQLGISFSVPHAAGDHVEALINYEDIKSNLKIDDIISN